MRVLMVSAFFDSHGGGIESVAGQLARRLRSRGHYVEWAATHILVERNVDKDCTVPMEGCNILEEMVGVPYPLWTATSTYRLVRAIRTAEIIHLHDCIYWGSALC